MIPIHVLLTALAVLGPLVHALPTPLQLPSENTPVLFPSTKPDSLLGREFHARAPIIIMDPELGSDGSRFSQADKSTTSSKQKSKSKSKVLRQILPMPLMLANRRAIQVRVEPYAAFHSPSPSTTSAAAAETSPPKAKSEISKDKDANDEDKDTNNKNKGTSEKGTDTKEKGKGKKGKGDGDKKATSG